MAKGWTIREVADQAAVSLGTVSNVLNRPHLVADETRERVQRVIEELGYVRNGSARQLRAGTSLAVGLVVIDVTNPFFTELARGVEDTASEAGLVVILCNSDESAEKEQRYIRLLEEQRVAGVLITPVGKAAPDLERLRSRGTATVLLDRHGRRNRACSVAVDDVHGGRLAAEHLLALGHRRVALLNGPDSVQQCVDRRRGFLSGLGGTRCSEIVKPSMSIEAGEEAAAELLRRRRLPSAVFCGNDMLAVGLLRRLSAHGVRVPEEIAIVGYDDVVFASSATVALTSVRQPAYEIGRCGMKLLLEETRSPEHRHRNVVFKPELVVRESTVGRPGPTDLQEASERYRG